MRVLSVALCLFASILSLKAVDNSTSARALFTRATRKYVPQTYRTRFNLAGRRTTSPTLERKEYKSRVAYLICNFDDDYCGFNQTSKGKLQWLRRIMKVAPRTGPSRDHTSGKGFYLMLNVQDSPPGSIASIRTPVLFAPVECTKISFWYFAYGAHLGRFSVRTLSSPGSYDQMWEPVFEETQPEFVVKSWQHFEKMVPLHDKHYVVVFDGEAGQGPEGNYAIDDIRIVATTCPPHLTLKPPDSGVTTPKRGKPVASPSKTTSAPNSNGPATLPDTAIAGIVIVVVIVTIGAIPAVVLLVRKVCFKKKRLQQLNAEQSSFPAESEETQDTVGAGHHNYVAESNVDGPLESNTQRSWPPPPSPDTLSRVTGMKVVQSNGRARDEYVQQNNMGYLRSNAPQAVRSNSVNDIKVTIVDNEQQRTNNPNTSNSQTVGFDDDFKSLTKYNNLQPFLTAPSQPQKPDSSPALSNSNWTPSSINYTTATAEEWSSGEEAEYRISQAQQHKELRFEASNNSNTMYDYPNAQDWRNDVVTSENVCSPLQPVKPDVDKDVAGTNEYGNPTASDGDDRKSDLDHLTAIAEIDEAIDEDLSEDSTVKTDDNDNTHEAAATVIDENVELRQVELYDDSAVKTDYNDNTHEAAAVVIDEDVELRQFQSTDDGLAVSFGTTQNAGNAADVPANDTGDNARLENSNINSTRDEKNTDKGGSENVE